MDLEKKETQKKPDSNELKSVSTFVEGSGIEDDLLDPLASSPKVVIEEGTKFKETPSKKENRTDEGGKDGDEGKEYDVFGFSLKVSSKEKGGNNIFRRILKEKIDGEGLAA
jgi:hypothetical protein